MRAPSHIGDGHATAGFYRTPRGIAAARLIRDRLEAMWPALPGQSLLGLGFAAPYLPAWKDSAARCIALSPQQCGPCAWAPSGRNLACVAEEDALPFADLSFDRILIVHGLEAADHARRMLREVWRVLKDDGRLLIVAPSRRSVWAHMESTPFGQGQPYSAGQIGRLLAGGMFSVERRDTALYLPPIRASLALRHAALIERTGRRVLPRMAGVTITEAVKDVHGIMPIARVARRRLVLAEAA